MICRPCGKSTMSFAVLCRNCKAKRSRLRTAVSSGIITAEQADLLFECQSREEYFEKLEVFTTITYVDICGELQKKFIASLQGPFREDPTEGRPILHHRYIAVPPSRARVSATEVYWGTEDE